MANPHLLLGNTVLTSFLVGIVPLRNGYECVAMYGRLRYQHTMTDNVPKRPGVDPEPGSRAQIETLTEVCIDDLLNALGLSGLRRSRRPLELLIRIPGRRLARQIATYDEIVGKFGLSAGGEWALERMTRRLKVEGRERVPRDGSLLLVSNHPGLSDVVALFRLDPEAGPARGGVRVAVTGRAAEHLPPPLYRRRKLLPSGQGPSGLRSGT